MKLFLSTLILVFATLAMAPAAKAQNLSAQQKTEILKKAKLLSSKRYCDLSAADKKILEQAEKIKEERSNSSHAQNQGTELASNEKVQMYTARGKTTGTVRSFDMSRTYNFHLPKFIKERKNSLPIVYQKQSNNIQEFATLFINKEELTEKDFYKKNTIL